MSYRQLLDQAGDRGVLIVTRDGREASGKLLKADRDSIVWGDSETDILHALPASAVDHLELQHSYWWQGAVLGFVGVTVPEIWAGAWAPYHPSKLESPLEYYGRTMTVMSGIAGAMLGGVSGWLIRHTDQFQVRVDSSNRQSR